MWYGGYYGYPFYPPLVYPPWSYGAYGPFGPRYWYPAVWFYP
jgi:hypothetical protein